MFLLSFVSYYIKYILRIYSSLKTYLGRRIRPNITRTTRVVVITRID